MTLDGGLAMARKTMLTVEVGEAERRELEGICRHGKCEQRVAMRARIVLMAAQGRGLVETARGLGVSVDQVRYWRKRWIERAEKSVMERLADDPRSGAPATFTAENICAITALACEPPENSGIPITHWSQNELAREAVRRKIVPRISQRSVGRFLKSGPVAAASQPLLADGQARRAVRRKGSGHL